MALSFLLPGVFAVLIVAVCVFIFCCLTYNKEPGHLGSSGANNYPPVYTIPVFEEQQGDEEEIIRIYELYFQPSSRDPPVYGSGDVSPPPPYVLEPPPYLSPLPLSCINQSPLPPPPYISPPSSP